MQIFLITTAALALTFLLNPMLKKINKKIDQKRSFKLHVHHSVLGVLLIVAGITLGGKAITAIGLGIYLAHGVEEMYFNRKHFPKAFFIFVTS